MASPSASAGRGTRAERRQENKAFDEYIIKCSLPDALVSSQGKHAFMEQVQQRVEAFSMGIHRMSLAVNLLVRQCLASNKDPRRVELPDFLSNASAGQVFQLIFGGGDVSFPVISEFHERWNDRLPPPPVRFVGDTNAYVRGAELYRTNYRNLITTTLLKRQKVFLAEWGSRHGVPENQAYVLQRHINGWRPSPNEPEHVEGDNAACAEMIAFHREVLRLDDGEALTDAWIKHNYERAIVYLAMIHRYMTGRTGAKAFKIAPIASIRAACMHIDTPVLHGIMRDAGMVTCGFDAFDALRDDQWSSVFRTDRYLTRRQRETCRFTHTVQTDGVSVSIHYRRPRRDGVEEPKHKGLAAGRKKRTAKVDADEESLRSHTAKMAIEPKDDDRVLGVDNGRVNIITVVEVLPDGSWKVWKLTRAQFYEESGILAARRCTEKWNRSVRESLNALSLVSTKELSVASFAAYLDVVMAHYETLWSEFMRRRWARQRFQLYSGKRSVLSRFLSSLEDGSGRRIVLAYGDAKFASGGRGELSVPTTTLDKECARRFATVPIGEHRSTQVHCGTRTRMSEVRERGGNGRKVRGLLWCESTNGCKFIDRDVNAALNMLRLYHALPERPTEMRRDVEAQEKPPCKWI